MSWGRRRHPGNLECNLSASRNPADVFGYIFYIYRKSENVKFIAAIFVFIVMLIGQVFIASGQKQLVLLKKQKILLRLTFGDEIILKTKGSDTKLVSYVNNLFDTAVMVHKTVIPFHKIDRVYFKRSNFANVVGTILVVGGIGYFVIDQLNVIVVNGDKPTLNDNVTATSVGMAAVGLPMMLIKKKSQRIRGKYRLMTVDEGSPFYQRELQHVQF